jgi:protoporphyrinogen oxidase
VVRCKLSNGKGDVDPIDNAEKWVISNFGKEVYRCFFKDYIPKVMGLPATRVTEEWGTERHKFYKEHNLWQKSTRFFLDFLVNRENRDGFLDVYYPEHGAQQLTEAIGKEVQKLGGEIHLRTTVDKIEVCEGKVTGLLIKRDGIREHIHVRDGSFVMSTMPITSLFSALTSSNGDVDDIRRTSRALRYRNLWLFNLVVKRERLKDKAQIYFPEHKYVFKRIYEPKNLLKEPVHNGKTAICVEVCYNHEDEIESMGEGTAFSQVMAGLRDFYNISEADVLDMWSKKVPFAYSIYEMGYRETLSKLAEYLFGIANLISFGRQGSFRYNHMTNRVMNACNTLHRFLISGMTKKEFMSSPDPKSEFF